MTGDQSVSHELLGTRIAEHLRCHDPSVHADDLARAMAAADLTGNRLDQALVELGVVTEAHLLGMLQSHFGLLAVEQTEVPAAAILSEVLTPSYLSQVKALPIAFDNDGVELAMCDPLDDFTAQAIGLKLRRAVRRRLISRNRFDEAFTSLYGDEWLDQTRAAGDLRQASGAAEDIDILRDAASDAPVVRFVQRMLRDAVDAGASDIHLRPLQHSARMSFRIDGSLVPRPPPDADMLPGIISRLKILARLDISERRLPQDGKVRAAVAGRQMDVRLSTMPHAHGEGAVLRLLGGEAAVSSLGDLGFSSAIEAGLDKLFADGQGLVLVTGPTGSGKTTTLHAGLRRLIRPDLNVVTIEDPIEYRTEGAAQIQIDERIGLSFPRVLRSLLRQDPDVILLGEIRDGETARIAVQAALTGHLVLATLHANSAMAAVPRLIDMGVEPYLLTAVLRGVLAQRLVRRLCQTCHGSERSERCEECGGTHCAGRLAVGELLLTDPEMAAALAQSHDLPARLYDRVRAGGFRPMAEDVGLRVTSGEIAADDARTILHA